MSKPFNLKRILIVAFIVLLAVLFTLEFGPGSPGATTQANEVIAHVGNKKIMLSDLLNAINPEMEPLLRNPDLAELVEGYYLNLLEQLVDATFLEQQAPREGIAISNAQLLAHLQQNQAFHKEGQFDPQTYQRLVQSNLGLSTVTYERELRANIARYKLQQFLDYLSYVSEEELYAEYTLVANKANVRFVRFSPAQLAFGLSAPTPQELAQFVTENAHRLEAFYQQNTHDYMEPERLRLRHMFIERLAKASDDTSPETEEPARQKAQALLLSLQQGAEFETLARESSEDLETKAKGGDLGWVEAHQLPPGLTNAVFNLKVGETSPVLETPRGYFIYRIEERTERHPKPLQDVQQDIALTLWTQQKSEQLAYAEAKKTLEALLQGKPLDALFPPASSELGNLLGTPFSHRPTSNKPEAVTTGLFAANHSSIPRLGDNSTLKNLIFQRTSPGPLPEIQRLGQDFLVMELIERQNPTQAGFEEEKHHLRETLQKNKALQTQAELLGQMKAHEQPKLFPEKLKKLSRPGS